MTGNQGSRAANGHGQAPGHDAVVVWFRQDLRLADNPALTAAAERGGPVIPVYIQPHVAQQGAWAPGAASRVWLHRSLAALGASLRVRRSRLVLAGRPAASALEALLEIIEHTGARAVMWNRCYEPDAIARDTEIKAALRARGVEVQTFNAALLHEPWTIGTRDGRPFQVFTPFWRACLAAPTPPEPLPPPAVLPAPPVWPPSLDLEALELEPRIDWASGIRAAWTPGEEGALARLDALVDGLAERYGELRDRPDVEGTSRLSPHLHFGELGPRQVWHALGDRAAIAPGQTAGIDTYLRELGWREFSHHLLFHFPATPEQPLRPSFARFPWAPPSEGAVRAWQRGRTGYPLVDAGMRQLWSTGWMHNRVRMIVASFLVKDLLLPWQEGARWFWDTLVDADLAQNTLGWQWTAGSGADAAPYFRIFNPITQGRRFDPDGDYVRRWVPELSRIRGNTVHVPWELPAAELKQVGVVLGRTYPERIVDHAWARERALAAYATLIR